MKSEFMKKAAAKCGKVSFKLRQRSPEILMALGVMGTVVSTVLACRATLKAQNVVKDAKEKLGTVRACEESEELKESGTYTEHDAKRDKAIVYAQAGAGIAKLYLFPVALGAASISCMIGSNTILRKRGAALLAAYRTLDEGFREYRESVKKRYGEEADRELRFGAAAKRKDTENKETEEEPEKTGYSVYARIFDEFNPEYERDSDRNRFFLTLKQNYFNDLLKARGYIFLNEVYEELGFEKTRAGQIVGWLYAPGDNSHTGDNYIDFGMFDVSKEGARDFVNGYEKAIILDFNVDGPIIDSFEKYVKE